MIPGVLYGSSSIIGRAQLPPSHQVLTELRQLSKCHDANCPKHGTTDSTYLDTVWSRFILWFGQIDAAFCFSLHGSGLDNFSFPTKEPVVATKEAFMALG